MSPHFNLPDVIRGALRRAGLADLAALCLLLVPGLSTIAIGLNAGEFWWTDEARHALNSVFIYDFLREGLSQDPLDYALRYFAQYPALALNWYPPGFYVAEGLVFQALGASEFSARLSVFLFFAAGLIVWYFWVSRKWGRLAAVLSGLLFALHPQVVLWTRSVMLDTPATVMVILSVVLFDRYLDRSTWRTATLAGATIAGALLVKQTTLFVVPALLAYAIAAGRWKLLVQRQAIPALLLVTLALGFVAVHALKFGDTAVAGLLERLPSQSPSKLSLERWMIHPRTVVDVVGWPLLACISLGLVAALRPTTRTRQDTVVLLWLAFWYVTTTILIGPGNSARYVIYVMPALALLAARGMEISAAPVVRLGVLSLLLLTLGSQFLRAYESEPRYVSGYREAAQHVLASTDSGTILFAGKHDGNFIFHVRLGDPEERRVILRADKVLVSMSVHKTWGVRSNVDDVQDVRELLDKFHVNYVVIERPDIVGIKEFDMLAQVAEGSDFQLETAIPVRTNVPAYAGITIQIYRRKAGSPSAASSSSVTIPVMGREIRIPL
jgi:hypothetical protein